MTPTLPEALSTLQGWLPPNPADDTQPQAAARVVIEACEPEIKSWMSTYLQAQKRFESLAMAVWEKVTDGATFVELVDLAGDFMDDCIDDESLAAFHKARDAAFARDAAHADAALLLGTAPVGTPGEETG